MQCDVSSLSVNVLHCIIFQSLSCLLMIVALFYKTFSMNQEEKSHEVVLFSSRFAWSRQSREMVALRTTLAIWISHGKPSTTKHCQKSSGKNIHMLSGRHWLLRERSLFFPLFLVYIFFKSDLCFNFAWIVKDLWGCFIFLLPCTALIICFFFLMTLTLSKKIWSALQVLLSLKQ